MSTCRKQSEKDLKLAKKELVYEEGKKKRRNDEAIIDIQQGPGNGHKVNTCVVAFIKLVKVLSTL